MQWAYLEFPLFLHMWLYPGGALPKPEQSGGGSCFIWPLKDSN